MEFEKLFKQKSEEWEWTPVTMAFSITGDPRAFQRYLDRKAKNDKFEAKARAHWDGPKPSSSVVSGNEARKAKGD